MTCSCRRLRSTAALVAVVVLAALYLFLTPHLARPGDPRRRGQPEGAALVGVNIATVAALTFAVGVAAAGAGGSIVSVLYPFLPGSHYQWIARLLSIVVLGGLGSLPGAVIGALLLGIAEAMTVDLHLAVVGGRGAVRGDLRRAAVRPQGLLGTRLREDVGRMSRPRRRPDPARSRAGRGVALLLYPVVSRRPLLPEHDHPLPGLRDRGDRTEHHHRLRGLRVARSGRVPRPRRVHVGDPVHPRRGVAGVVWVPVGGRRGGGRSRSCSGGRLRSRGPSFVIITVAFLFLVQIVAINWASVTNGPRASRCRCRLGASRS